MPFLGSALELTAMCSLGWGNLVGFDWNDLPVGREFDRKFLKKVKSPPYVLPPPPRRHYIDKCIIYSLFCRHNFSCTVFWVSSFHLSVNIVVLYQFTVPGHLCISKTSHQKLKREVSRTGKKRFKIAIMFSGRNRRSREERNGFVKAHIV